MPKSVMLRDDIAKKLDKIREKYSYSYSKAIESLLPEDSGEIWLNIMNNGFSKVNGVLPDLRVTIGLMRVILIHFNRLPLSEKASHVDELNNKLNEILGSIIKVRDGTNASWK